MKKILKLLGIVLVIFLLAGIGFGFFMMNGQSKVLIDVPEGIDLSQVPDGVYSGSYDGYRWKNTLSITVSNHQIVSIEIMDDITIEVADVTNDLFNRVIQENNTLVDVVAGATISSHAYLHAIEAAFQD